ncbi:TetR/AcrR family transcriptional regulator [Flindersiella endophytica]
MTEPDPADLTARARIRNAAMVHFGEHGFEKATIRGIAQTAGVSSGLVRHHFGSKQALREACDEHLARTISRLNDQVWGDRGTGGVNYVTAGRLAMGPYQRYLARALSEGAAGDLFDSIVSMVEEWLAAADAERADQPAADRRSRATVFTAMALGVPMLYSHVARGLGVDLESPEGDRRLARALLDIYSHPLLAPSDAAAARDALDRQEAAEAGTA